MPKYRNKGSTPQPLLVEGKRLLIKPGHVADVPKELQLTFFENLVRVADNTPVTPQTADDTFSLDDHFSVKPQQTVTVQTPLQQKLHQNNPFVKAPPVQPTVDTKQMYVTREEFQKLKDEMATVLRRLDIMKRVIQDMHEGHNGEQPKDS